MKKILFLSAIVLGLATTSCDSYLDINDDPNAVTQVDNDYLMPTPEMNLASTMGVAFNVYGGYCAEVYGQGLGGSNYLDYSRFFVNSVNTQASWTQLYSRVLKNLQVIIDQSSKAPGDKLAATVLRAYTLQTLVDAYGECPYKEAMINSQPAYDEGQDIYNGIIKEIDDALEGITGTETVCKNFLFSSSASASTGTAAAWVKFANSLKLRILMRERAAADVNAQLAALVADGNFITSDVVYDKCWSNATGSFSPLYQEYQKITSDMAPGIAFTATVTNLSDPRYTFNYVNGDNGFLGAMSGSNLSTDNVTGDDYLAKINYRFNMPVFLMTVAEVDFFLAEYYAAVASNAALAQNYYEAAIEASFNTCGVAGAAAYITRNPLGANAVKTIAEQKWIALGHTLQGFESWCELRRLNYPAFNDLSATDVIAMIQNHNSLSYPECTIFTPYNNYLSPKTLCARFPYPAISTGYNSNAPATKEATVAVFWDK
jgi:hypothetical protein